MTGTPDSTRLVPRPMLGGRTAWVVLTVGQFAAVVAVLQRSSLGVAATDASGRFGITAATLAAFSMVQLLVYAGLQVPVGVLIDRYGSRRLIVVGSLIMAGAQAMFAFAATLPLAYRGPGGARRRRRADVHQRDAARARVVPARAHREGHQRHRAGQPVGLRRLGGRVRRGARRGGGRRRSCPLPRSASRPRCWRCSCCGTPRWGARRASPSARRSPRPATGSARRGPNRAPGSGSGWGSWPCSPA